MKRKFVGKAFTTWLVNGYRNLIRHPRYGWWLALGTLLYLLSPLDLLPDVLPIAGWVDDGLLATVLVTEVAQVLSDRFKAQKVGSAPAAPTPETIIDVEVMPAQ